jgi:GTP-binding nuclear protein Ran
MAYNNQTLKCILVGDGGVGKTVFTKRHLIGEFDRKYIATIGVEVHPLVFRVTSDSRPSLTEVCFNIWDTAGQEKFGGLRDGYYVRGQCAIVMADATSRLSMRHVPRWVKDIRSTCGNIPIVLCLNKVEVRERKVDPQVGQEMAASLGVMYCEISARTNFHFEKPFLWLARECLARDLQFAEQLAIVPPTVDDIVLTADMINEERMATGTRLPTTD